MKVLSKRNIRFSLIQRLRELKRLRRKISRFRDNVHAFRLLYTIYEKYHFEPSPFATRLGRQGNVDSGKSATVPTRASFISRLLIPRDRPYRDDRASIARRFGVPGLLARIHELCRAPCTKPIRVFLLLLLLPASRALSRTGLISRRVVSSATRRHRAQMKLALEPIHDTLSLPSCTEYCLVPPRSRSSWQLPSSRLSPEKSRNPEECRERDKPQRTKLGELSYVNLPPLSPTPCLVIASKTRAPECGTNVRKSDQRINNRFVKVSSFAVPSSLSGRSGEGRFDDYILSDVLFFFCFISARADPAACGRKLNRKARS